jgi:GTPase Era involved in 16S rRNA processing
MTPFLIEAGAVVAEKAADKGLPLVSPLLNKLRHLLTQGHTRLLIFGVGGSGKSTLTRFLAGSSLEGQQAAHYETTLVQEKTAFHDPNVVCTIIDTPGQERYRTTVLQDLAVHLVRGKINVLINVVSWGHDSIEAVGYTETDIFKSSHARSIKEFVPKWLAAERSKELVLLREFTPRIKDAARDTKLWMITLVTKQDLWWEHRDDVRAHYERGEYRQVIEEIANHRGQHFHHEYLSMSLVLRNLTDDPGHLLVPTTGGYDVALQAGNQANVLRTITSFISG